MFFQALLVRDPQCARKRAVRVYASCNISGLVLLPSFVAPEEQRKLVRWALCDQARHPNETNLDTHYVLPTDGLWNQYVRSCRGDCVDDEIFPRASPSVTPNDYSDLGTSQETIGPRKLISNDAASPDNYRDLANTPKPSALPSRTLRPIATSSLVPKLRWANIGWYYHWGTKQYDFSRGPGEISGLVRETCKRAVEDIPWEKVFGGDSAATTDDGEWGEGGPDWMHWRDTYGGL